MPMVYDLWRGAAGNVAQFGTGSWMLVIAGEDNVGT